MKVLNINFEKVEKIGRNWVGNRYLYRWVVYVSDDRKEETGMYLCVDGKEVPSKVGFIGTKPDVKQWLNLNKLKYNW